MFISVQARKPTKKSSTNIQFKIIVNEHEDQKGVGWS